MPKSEISGRSIFTDQPIKIEFDKNGIIAMQDIPEDNNLPYISPGFLDMQVNGYYGVDYSLKELKAEDVRTLVDHLSKSGTTCHVPTFVSMPHAQLLRNLKVTCEAMKRDEIVGAAILGFHIEGPFISPIDGPRGVHDLKYIRTASIKEFEEWQEAAEGNISYLTVAPETEGALDFIRAVVKSGVKVAIGHSGASPEQIREAIDAGATLSTHLGNGSYTEIPRLRNYIWEQLAADELSAGLICDGYHLPEAVVKVFARAKGLDKLFLVSDAALLGGYTPGVYKWGDLDIDVHEDGHLGLHGTSVLAGAAHLLDWDIVRFMEYTGNNLKDTIKLCTINPAQNLGFDTSGYCSFEVGGPANFSVFSYEKGAARLNIARTIMSGIDVYKA
ncbi:MAG: amidohydrolase family protein [Sphaerochaetaceae bacterium]|jgi:N-acetylglucosamine-6-phosphate deacetylase|nr:amidohydrolase family protein [Sphaerochaetaceae bacterium]MDY0372410.1 amidohydrolase family protein [Sphaerochaetaceae bacterium]